MNYRKTNYSLKIIALIIKKLLIKMIKIIKFFQIDNFIMSLRNLYSWKEINFIIRKTITK